MRFCNSGGNWTVPTRNLIAGSFTSIFGVRNCEVTTSASFSVCSFCVAMNRLTNITNELREVRGLRSTAHFTVVNMAQEWTRLLFYNFITILQGALQCAHYSVIGTDDSPKNDLRLSLTSRTSCCSVGVTRFGSPPRSSCMACSLSSAL